MQVDKTGLHHLFGPAQDVKPWRGRQSLWPTSKVRLFFPFQRA